MPLFLPSSNVGNYLHVSVSRYNVDQTPALNSTSYVVTNFVDQIPIDLNAFPFTHFRWAIRGLSTEAGQTVTVQLDSGVTGLAPAGAGNDLVVTNTVQTHDSGWKQRTDGLTGFQIYSMCLKGSNTTVDLTQRRVDLLLKIEA